MPSGPGEEKEPVLLRVDAAAAGLRLDTYLAAALGLGRRAAARLAPNARINGRRASKGDRLTSGDEVLLTIPPAEAENTPGPEIRAKFDDVLVVCKPAGLPTVALAGRHGPSVAAWLRRNHPECASIGRPGESGLVHRLDNGTSGVLLAARSPRAYAELRDQFRRHCVEKVYLALVHGILQAPCRLDASIGQHKKARSRVRVLPGGERRRYHSSPATTDVSPVRAVGGFSLVEARTRTGVRHQIRAHLAQAGHPLVGDIQYGGAAGPQGDGFFLHASRISWEVGNGQRRVASCLLPEDFDRVLRDSGHRADPGFDEDAPVGPPPRSTGAKEEDAGG